MITRLQDNILNDIARHILTTAPDSTKSWFLQVKKLCAQYNLPHPITLLDNPYDKETFKTLVSNAILDFWQTRYRNLSSLLPSLSMFHPEYMSLKTPHPLLTTVGSNPFQINKSLSQLLMLSGRYRTEKLCRFWSQNMYGACRLCSNPAALIQEDLQHILLFCPALNEARQHVTSIWNESLSQKQIVLTIVTEVWQTSADEICQLLLDCSTLPTVVRAVQEHGSQILQDLFYLTRLWAYSMHRRRQQLLGLK